MNSPINDIKQELNSKSQKELLALCLRLARYKKENKELLTYLLFEAHDLQGYINNVKAEMDEQFCLVNKDSFYFAKKGFRKILRNTNKYIRYSSSKEAEIELLIHFCLGVRASGLSILKSTALTNLYNTQVKKINTVISLLHEDLQYDYLKQAQQLLLR